jgi:hypothetical protein
MTKTKKIILLLAAFICLFGVMYSADFEAKPFFVNIINPFLAIADDGSEEEGEEEGGGGGGGGEEESAAIECPPLPPACQLFYIKKEDTNKCIETLKASNVYSSDPCGQK